MGWNYSSIPNCNGVTVEVMEWMSNFITHFIIWYDYLSMLELRLIRVSKRGPRSTIDRTPDPYAQTIVYKKITKTWRGFMIMLPSFECETFRHNVFKHLSELSLHTKLHGCNSNYLKRHFSCECSYCKSMDIPSFFCLIVSHFTIEYE